MGKADKLFQKAELEYITPFLKLWLAFNCWYKKDSEADTPPITSDRQAIDKYKGESRIKHSFLQLFENTSDTGKQFNESLGNLTIDVIDNYHLNNNQGRVTYSGLHRNPRVKKDKTQIGNSNFYISITEKDQFYEETIEIIYAVRCSLVHGDFDIDNQYFIQLVENSYKLMYPIMQKVLE